MKRIGSLALALMVLAGCFNSNSCMTQIAGPTATNNQGSPSPSPTPGGGCEAAASIQAIVEGNGPVLNGEQRRLDATARTASGQEIAGACAAAKQPTWTPFVGPCEFVTSPNGYNPEFRAAALGSCKTSVTLDAASADLSFTVQ